MSPFGCTVSAVLLSTIVGTETPKNPRAKNPKELFEIDQAMVGLWCLVSLVLVVFMVFLVSLVLKVFLVFLSLWSLGPLQLFESLFGVSSGS